MQFYRTYGLFYFQQLISKYQDMINKFFVLLFITVGILVSCNKPEDKAYLFTYFMGNGEDGLHLAYSYDGLKWDSLFTGESVLNPMIGNDRLMRDPSVARGKDGTFHMVWTSGWWDKGIGYASTRDFIHWSEQKYIPVMEYDTATVNTWAPEIFYDETDDLFYIIWASTITGKFPEVVTTSNETGLNHRQYFVTTHDFREFSCTDMFFDPGFSVIDGTIIKKDAKYWFIIKNEMSVPSEKNLRISFSEDIKSGFPIDVSENISGHQWAEGPTPLLIGDYVYIYFDKYRDRKYGAIRSTDGLYWEDVSNLINFPKGTRHGTAIEVSKSVIDELLEAEIKN